MEAPEVVGPALEAQLRASTPGEFDARFVRRVQGIEVGGLTARDEAVLARVTGVHPVADILRSRIEQQSLRRLSDLGVVQFCGVTPSDASHVLGTLDAWDAEAANNALVLFARKRTGSGERLTTGAKSLAQMIIDRLTYQTSLALLETAFAEESVDFGLPPEQLARHVLLQKGLDRHQGLVRLDAGLNIPVVGLGASASTYYPAVGHRLACEMILPEHAGVANAIGAVVGRVTMRKSGTITSPSEGRFRLHANDGPRDFADAEEAMIALEADLREQAVDDARASGAQDIQVKAMRDVKSSAVEGREVFIEATLTVEATGRPRIAHG
jgi:N-methylhydantoinase A/oxoprolinase/acetone carboxylase beta subunit